MNKDQLYELALNAGVEDIDELLLMDGYDDCIAGIVTRFGEEPFVCYDREKVIEKLQADGMSYEEAVEFHEFNQAGAFVGDRTPSFITVPCES